MLRSNARAVIHEAKAVGLDESQRKNDWVKADFEDFEGQQLFYGSKKRRNLNLPDASAADFL